MFKRKLIKELEKENSTLEDFNKHWTKKSKHIYAYDKGVDSFINTFLKKDCEIEVLNTAIIFKYKYYRLEIYTNESEMYRFASYLSVERYRVRIYAKSGIRPSYATMCKLFDISQDFRNKEKEENEKVLGSVIDELNKKIVII